MYDLSPKKIAPLQNAPLDNSPLEKPKKKESRCMQFYKAITVAINLTTCKDALRFCYETCRPSNIIQYIISCLANPCNPCEYKHKKYD